MKDIIGTEFLLKKRDVFYKKSDLIEFEDGILKAWESGEIRNPVHLSNGNEDELIYIFKFISKFDWVFSSWRNHYHALLHGISPEELKRSIMAVSMNTSCLNPKFYSSAIVGGIIPIAVGVAKSLQYKQDIHIKRHGVGFWEESPKVWVFIGDMTAETGMFHEAHKYSVNFDLPIRFVIEDNAMSVTTPTKDVWGKSSMENLSCSKKVVYYKYKSEYPHSGSGKWVEFNETI